MPVHDWTRADDGLFHDFHCTWLIHLKERLNAGLLPAGYYAMAEQHAGVHIPDVLAMSPVGSLTPPGRNANGVALAEPATDERSRLTDIDPVPRRRLAVRYNRRVVAVIEIVSPNNKNREGKAQAFAEKAADLIRAGVHLAVLDVLPPGVYDPGGLHPLVWRELKEDAPVEPAPADRPLTFVGYEADDDPLSFRSYAAVGDPLPSIPLFLDAGQFVALPLEQTYSTVFSEMPAELKAIVE